MPFEKGGRADKQGNKYEKNCIIYEMIKVLNEREKPIIFILWGNNAKSKEKFIDTSKHYVLKGVHPSPLSANRGFFGCKHFSEVNRILKELNEKEIDSLFTLEYYLKSVDEIYTRVGIK